MPGVQAVPGDDRHPHRPSSSPRSFQPSHPLRRSQNQSQVVPEVPVVPVAVSVVPVVRRTSLG